MLTDPIADLLTRIRNGQRAGHHSARVRQSKMSERILNVLKDEGFIDSFQTVEKGEGSFPMIDVTLKYDSSGAPLIKTLQRASRCGRRLYVKASEVPQIHCGLGLAIISTSQGVMSDRMARQNKVGGELIARVS